MSYYNNRQIYKMINDAIENYCPPTTYKNKKPTLEEFELKGTNIELIEKEYASFKKRQEIVGTILGGAWFALGGLPCGFVTAYLYENLNIDFDSLLGFIPIIVCILLYIFGFAILELLINLIKYNKKDEIDRIEKYNQALFQYNWWQKRKKKEFWYSLNGRQFEIEISNIFKKLGYKSRICKQGGDEGIDIEIEKNGAKEIVQCKAHKSKISPSVARDLLGTMYNKGINHAYLITLNGGTAGTIDFCKKNNITLWDINDILKNNEK